MKVIMKCSAVCSNAGAAFGFTVRQGHCIVHRESGLLPRVASVEAAKQESVRRAVGWLLAQPATAAHAVWKVPRKWVAEADALCRKAYRERLDLVGTGNSRQPLKAFLQAASTEWQSRV